MKPKRVAFLLNEFPTLTETFILNQIAFLLERGIDVHIFALYSGDFKKLHKQFNGFELENRVTLITEIPDHSFKRVLEVYSFLKNEGFWNNFSSLVSCLNPFVFGVSALKLTYFLYYTRLHVLKDFDLIHAHFGIMGVFIDKFLARGLLGETPYLVSFHGYDLVPNQVELNRERYRKMFLSAKMFTVNSNYTGRLLDKVNPNLGSRVKLLPESLDTSMFKNSNESFKQDSIGLFKIVWVGRLVEWKGPDTVIKVLEKIVKELGFSNIELIIIGKGPLQAVLEKTLLDTDLQEYVKLLGGQDHAVIKTVLGQSDLFLYTGRHNVETGRSENQGLVLMEAQAMGLPVVAFDVGGVGEGVLDGITGILVPSEDVQAFAEAIVHLLNDLPKRSLMGIAAREFVINRYDQNVLGNQLLEIYKEVLA